MMKKILTICLVLMVSGLVHAAPVTLDFDSGSFISGAIYSEDGFTFAVNSSGNHFDDDWNGAMGFHNGPGNPVYDNNVTLSFGGAAFDFVDIDLNFLLNSAMIELIGSNGSTFSSSTTGLQTVNLLNVTSVVFSINDVAGLGGAGWNNITVNNQPTSAPEPASLALLVLGLAGIRCSRKKKIA